MHNKIKKFPVKIILIFFSIFVFSSCSFGEKNIDQNLSVSDKIETVKPDENFSEEKTNSGVIQKQEKSLSGELSKEEKQEKIKEKIKEKILAKNKEKLANKKIKDNSIKVQNASFGKHCILDVCLDKEYGKIKDLGDKYVQKDKKNSEIIIGILKKDKSYIEKALEVEMVSDVYYVKKINNYYVKIHYVGSCGGTSIKQEIFSLNGEKIDNKFSNFSSIKIGNYILYPKFTFKEKGESPFSDGAKIFDNKKFNNTEEFKKYLEGQIFNKDKKKRYINNKYVIETSKGFYVFYEANFKQPEKIVYLGTDKKWLSKNIDKNGNFLNLELNNKILGYFGEKSAKGIVDNSGKRILKTDKVPVFKVKKFSDNGYYLLYMADGYKTQMFVEMCKPAVYIYDKNARKNSLNLIFEKSSYFTKIIPEFSSKNTWNFVGKNGKVEVENKNYDYLYYAIKVGDYKHNLDGWIVYGANIEKFFNDKLEKINFNEKEKKDFLEYWLSKYDKNKYYFVSFKYKKDLEKLVKLNFEIKPKKEFRVLLDSYELDYLSESKKQFLYSKVGDKFDKFLIKRFKRNSSDFEVFEWGGVLQKKDKFFVY